MNDKQFSSWEDAVNWLIEDADQQELVKACYFDRPALAAAERYYKSDEWQAIQKLLPEEKGKVLDVGAGMGIASFALAKDGWQVTALEPDSSSLVGAGAIQQLSEEAAMDIEVIEEWGESLPFADASFEVIHARQVLHHAHNLEQFCVELYRVLKPGGRLIATREHVISNDEQLPKFLEKHPLHNLYGGEHAYQRKVYVACLKKAGFANCIVLGTWDSIINYTPFTRHKLREMFLSRFGNWFGAKCFGYLFFSKRGFWVARFILSVVDRRPGRLYTFISDKTEEKL